MAATILIRELNTVSETPTDKTSETIRFKNADNATVDYADPLVKPASSHINSYEKWVRLYMDDAPTGAITTVRAYSDGSNTFGTGITAKAGATGSFVTPTSSDSSVATTDLFSYTSVAPLSLGAGPYDSAYLDTSFGSYLVMQMYVDSTAAAGISGSETLTIAYDES